MAALARPAPSVVADLGCGTGELLLRVLEASPASAGIGVDLDGEALAAARAAAEARGVAGRARFEEADATAWDGRADALICIGAAHAWGGTAAALEALHGTCRSLLFGWGFWAAGPSARSLEIIGDVPAGIDELVGAAAEAGWRIEDVQVSSQEEWDAFERSWCEGRDPEVAAAHWDAYENGYRGELGFAYLLLGAADGADATSLRSPTK